MMRRVLTAAAPLVRGGLRRRWGTAATVAAVLRRLEGTSYVAVVTLTMPRRRGSSVAVVVPVRRRAAGAGARASVLGPLPPGRTTQSAALGWSAVPAVITIVMVARRWAATVMGVVASVLAARARAASALIPGTAGRSAHRRIPRPARLERARARARTVPASRSARRRRDLSWRLRPPAVRRRTAAVVAAVLLRTSVAASATSMMLRTVATVVAAATTGTSAVRPAVLLLLRTRGGAEASAGTDAGRLASFVAMPVRAAVLGSSAATRAVRVPAGSAVIWRRSGRTPRSSLLRMLAMLLLSLTTLR